MRMLFKFIENTFDKSPEGYSAARKAFRDGRVFDYIKMAGVFFCLPYYNARARKQVKAIHKNEVTPKS